MAVFITNLVFIQILDHFWDWCAPFLPYKWMIWAVKKTAILYQHLWSQCIQHYGGDVHHWMACSNPEIPSLFQFHCHLHPQKGHLYHPLSYSLQSYLDFYYFNFRVTSILLTYRLFIHAISFAFMLNTTNILVARWHQSYFFFFFVFFVFIFVIIAVGGLLLLFLFWCSSWNRKVYESSLKRMKNAGGKFSSMYLTWDLMSLSPLIRDNVNKSSWIKDEKFR